MCVCVCVCVCFIEMFEFHVIQHKNSNTFFDYVSQYHVSKFISIHAIHSFNLSALKNLVLILYMSALIDFSPAIIILLL